MVKKLTLRNDEARLTAILLNELPHGSGIDSDWNIELVRGHGIRCSNSYHTMDCMGGYCDWMDFSVYYRWNEEQQQFEQKKLVADPHAIWMYDEDGHRYNDRDGIIEYLNDTFPTDIKVEVQYVAQP